MLSTSFLESILIGKMVRVIMYDNNSYRTTGANYGWGTGFRFGSRSIPALFP